ncbi:MAG: hydrogenase maturation protease [Candidatus Zixiibacteriota bacterium]|nr:MAG: hydrogenase maturation protease [candidate division Zixibacteria bacterium]
MKRTLVIGIGNGFRKDDGVGLEIARRIEELNIPGVTVSKTAGDLTNFVNIFPEYELLIIADSIKAAGNPGMNIRVDISDLDEDFELSPNISTHWLGILETLRLADNVGNLPEKTVIYGVEGADFSYGTGISPELFNTVEFIVGEIIGELTA